MGLGASGAIPSGDGREGVVVNALTTLPLLMTERARERNRCMVVYL